MAAGVRDDVSHQYTCFIRRSEDERLHGRFLSVLGMINVRGQNLSVLHLKKFFDLPERGWTDRKVIIVHNDRMEFGILADAILKTAKARGLTLPPTLIFQANNV